MASYLCKTCKHNNNGWCNKLRKNGLTKIQECQDFKSDATKKITIERTSKDYYGQQMVEIKINDESVEFPEFVLENFIKDKEPKSSKFTINYGD